MRALTTRRAAGRADEIPMRAEARPQMRRRRSPLHTPAAQSVEQISTAAICRVAVAFDAGSARATPAAWEPVVGWCYEHDVGTTIHSAQPHPPRLFRRAGK